MNRSIAAGILFLYASLAAFAADELVTNGDFEQVTDQGLPANWSYIAADKGDGTLTIGQGVEGGKCAQIECTRYGGIWGPGVGQVGLVTVQQGKWYALKFQARGERITAPVWIGLRDMQHWDDNVLWRYISVGPNWREYTMTFQSHRDLAKEVSRLQWSFDSTGSLWLDRVSLQETTKPRSPNLTDMGPVKNRVPNSSFELGTCGWGTYGHDTLYGTVDQAAGAHGKASFRLPLDATQVP